MSGASARYALPLEDRPPDLQPPQAQDSLALDGETALPGVALEFAALGTEWDNINLAFGRFMTDAKFANTQKQLASLEASADALFAQIGKAAALAMHARKAVTAKRVRERNKE